MLFVFHWFVSRVGEPKTIYSIPINISSNRNQQQIVDLIFPQIAQF